MRTAALLAGFGLLVACTNAGEEADPGRLVVTGPDRGVHLVDPEGGERQTLQEEGSPPAPVQPTASPDGELVVWTALADDRPVMRIHERGETRDLEAPTVPFYYSFDADTTTMAALGNEPDGDGVALMLVDLDGGQARIVDSDRPYYLDWHPEESLLAVHVGFRELALFDEEERSPLPFQPGDFQAPAWTDDGRIVALRRSEGAPVSLTAQPGGEELVVVDIGDGSAGSVAAAGGPLPFDVAGQRVAFVEGGAGPLTVVGLDGQDRVEVSPEVVVSFEWSPDGEMLLFHVVEEEVGLVPYVWDGQETSTYPPYEPTGVFVTQYLPFWSQYTRTITQWAPDGSAFAYAAAGEDPTVWVQPREGERRDMGRGAMVTWSP